jgi:hypothetical protein
MTIQQEIDAARKKIGPAADDDYVLLPEEHAKTYADSGLAGIFMGSEAKSVIQRYRLRDTEAIDAQNRFKRVSALANASLFLATGASSSIMVFALVIEEPFAYTTGAAIAGFALAAVAGVCLTMIRGGKLLEAWMRHRSEAEMLRIRYFKLVTSAAAREDMPTPLSLMILEYFRRYQVEIQVAYYRVKGQRHSSAARTALVVSAVAMGAVTLANASAGVLVAVDEKWAALAALALIAQALATSGSNSEALNQDARNAERYDRIYHSLADLAGRLDEVRMSVAHGDKAIVASFVDAFHEGLSAENRQWTEDLGNIGSAVDKLGEQLESIRAKLGDPDARSDGDAEAEREPANGE